MTKCTNFVHELVGKLRSITTIDRRRKRIKRKSRDGETGYFGAINLLAPRPDGGYLEWRDDVTYVQLLYSFVSHTDALDGAPMVLDRTLMTFYDFDSSGVGEANECIMFGPGDAHDIVNLDGIHTT